MIVTVLAVLATLNGTPEMIYSYPYRNIDACKSAKIKMETAGPYELNSMCLKTEIDQKWVQANYQGWVLGMVRINEKTAKKMGSPVEIPMSNKAECKEGILQSMYKAHNKRMDDIAFFCFDSTQD